MKIHPLLPIVLATVLGACTAEDSPSARRESQLADEAPAPAKAAPTAADLPSPPEPDIAQGTAMDHPDQQRLRDLIQAMGEAADDASEATGETECERAFDSSYRFAQALRDRVGGTPPTAEPDRATFIEACEALPEDVQRCMVMSYSMSHQPECSALRREMTPEIRQKVQELTTLVGLNARQAEAAEAAEAAPTE